MTNRRLRWLQSAWVTTGITVAIAAALTSTALLIPPPVGAVHDDPGTPFQLDGNPSQSIGGYGASLLDDDWDVVMGFGDLPYPPTRLFSGALESEGETFVDDTLTNAAGNELTAFIKSNKDTDDTDTWDWSASAISPPKNDITNAYAKAYRTDIDGNAATPDHLIVYFGADRYADDGDAAMGFWFFRNAVGPGPNNRFAGKHAIGDVLIQIDYRGAGDNEIEVFKWVGTGGNAGGGKLQRLALGSSNNAAAVICTAANAGVPADAACVTTNTIALDSPWAYVPKGQDSVGPNRFPPRVFMEGGFDVTALVGNVCFSGYLAETRSSHSETAELKDFAFGDFDLCSIDVEKACVAGSAVPDPNTGNFTTTRLVTITNSSFSGSLSDVELRDLMVSTNADASLSTTCAIKSFAYAAGAATGVPAAGHVFSQPTDSYEVADTLSGSMTVELECTSPSNTFQNSVAVKSRASAGQPQDITDEDTEPSEGAGNFHGCEAVLDVGLSVKKWCQGDDGLTDNPNGPNPYFSVADSENPLGASVFLKPPSYVPLVCVDIELSNPSTNQKMVVDTFTDSDLGNLVPAGGLTLDVAGAAGAKYAVQSCYVAGNPDQAIPVGGVLPPLLAHNVTYSDTVSATAHGKVDLKPTSAGPVTVTCSLCADEE